MTNLNTALNNITIAAQITRKMKSLDTDMLMPGDIYSMIDTDYPNLLDFDRNVIFLMIARSL